MDIKNNHFNKLYLSNTLNCSYIAVTNKTEILCENLFVEKNFVHVHLQQKITLKNVNRLRTFN